MHRSALFWRITACIFASVILIEGVLLAYSWVTERNRMIARVENSAELLISSLDAKNPSPQLVRQMNDPDADSELNILAFVHRRASGSSSSIGDLPDALLPPANSNQSRFDRDSNSRVTQHQINLTNGKSDTLYLRIDTAWIGSYMQKYVLRILGMIAVITLFLTVACLLFLKPLLIDPLRRLERLLTFKSDTGINSAEVTRKDLHRRDELGAVFRSFTELREKVTEAERKLEHLANHDDLTGLANRRNMIETVQSCIDTYDANGTTSTLMMIDLDHFKEINDSAGHAAGDSVLRTIANILTECTDNKSLVTRQGGDEFAVILPGVSLEAAVEVAERIRTTLEQTNFIWNTQGFDCSASIGIAEITPELSTREALIMAADSGCIAAKRQGKNKIVTHESLTQGHEALWINRILDSIENNKFVLFRQSIVRINSDLPSEHFEILLRMENPEGGFYSPGDFLPVAERNNLMPKVDRWVIDNAMTWLADQDMSPEDDYCMNINISANSLAELEFRDYLQEKVSHSTQINPYVCFEITESAAMTSYDQTVALLNKLKSHGCTVALDDFGTGFSSLAHIQKLPLDYIKIDGCFIKQIIDSKLDQTVVKSVAEIAKVQNIKTVAEFIEDEATVEVLKGLDIDYGQGFFFSRPEALIEQSSDTDIDRAA